MDIATVSFEPDGRTVRALVGIAILEVAKTAGIGIRSECFGKGLCGKCKVIVKNRNALSELTQNEIERLSMSEIRSGYRLACQAKVLKDTVITIPAETRLSSRKIEISGSEKLVKVDPLVTKVHVTLPVPTLSDARADYERFLGALSKLIDVNEVEVDHLLLKQLPDVIRHSNFDVSVTIWGNQKVISIELADSLNEIFGFAIDIGTSKIVGYLVDLVNGNILDIASIENPQIIYGEDIMTRITFGMAKPKNLKMLHKLLVNAVNKIIYETCLRANIKPNRIYEIVAVGNTAMHHFFLGLQPMYTALSPYTPVIKRQVNIRARELNININPSGIITVLPIIAGFVGADAVADVLATGMYDSTELSLLVDVGTNTEIFVGNSRDLLSCSCASGPAFEGMHIKCGMKAVTGAIEKVNIHSDFTVEYETIGDEKPVGLCGSAVIDIIAEMFKQGIIDYTGKFNRNIKTSRLRRSNGETEFVIAWKHETATGNAITVTQKDIHEVQLAKAAIYAGCSILFKKKGINEKQLDKILVAGSFGNYINPENAVNIGLLPDVPKDKIIFVGNTAIMGAKMALLSKEIRKKADEISRKVRYLELATDPNFKEEFLAATFIPHEDLNRFPSIKSFCIRRDS
ncbi:TPA: DUF4445 domain-containing protein [Candidatus Poribacteria bacterium]|nr:DUF4445 domain-containing protein [Candidatus Poribacteria bacterium]